MDKTCDGGQAIATPNAWLLGYWGELGRLLARTTATRDRGIVVIIAAQRDVPCELCEMYRSSKCLPLAGISNVAANFALPRDAGYMLSS